MLEVCSHALCGICSERFPFVFVLICVFSVTVLAVRIDYRP
jgi:hypothetical protein